MKIIEKLNGNKIPIVRIDNTLKKYLNMPIFQNKVDKANETLSKAGLPRIKIKD